MTKPLHAAPGRRFDSYVEFYQESAYGAFPQEHRGRGSLGLTMLRVQQEPIDLIDAAVPEITFQREMTGGGRFILDIGDGRRVTERMPPDTLTVMPPDTEARYDLNYAAELLVVALPVARVLPLLDGSGLLPDVFTRRYAVSSPALRANALMDKMWRMSALPMPGADLYLDGVTLQFLAIVAGEAALSPLGFDRPEDVRIARAVDYAEAHLDRPLNVTELAAVAAMSPSRFSRVFKATTGETVWVFVQRRRLERARDMLANGREPIAGIATACGLTDQTHMTKLFRRAYGVTPKAFRDG